HETTAAVGADRVVLLAAGEILFTGPPEQLLPQTHLLEHHGVRPRDVDRLCQELGVNEYPQDLQEAGEVMYKKIHVLTSCPTKESRIGGLSQFPRSPHRNSFADTQDRSLPQGGKEHSLLRLESVFHVYPGDSPAVYNVSLTIEEGEFIALLGQNGSGKTTLAKHMSGLLVPTQGKVLLQGRELTHIPLHELAQDISYVFQNPDHQLFAETVEEEIAFGPRNIGLTAAEVEIRVEEALTAVSLHGKRAH